MKLGLGDGGIKGRLRNGLPIPLINVRVNGYEVDAYFPEHNLIVELDGWAFHREQTAFVRDRDQDSENLKVGIRTARLTRDRIIETPAYEAERLRQILDQK
jgi:very-short-patch-repair endonuclease